MLSEENYEKYWIDGTISNKEPYKVSPLTSTAWRCLNYYPVDKGDVVTISGTWRQYSNDGYYGLCMYDENLTLLRHIEFENIDKNNYAKALENDLIVTIEDDEKYIAVFNAASYIKNCSITVCINYLKFIYKNSTDIKKNKNDIYIINDVLLISSTYEYVAESTFINSENNTYDFFNVNSGKFQSAGVIGWNRTDFIEINPEEYNYYLSGQTYYWLTAACFDDDKHFISACLALESTSIAHDKSKLDIPSNAKYIIAQGNSPTLLVTIYKKRKSKINLIENKINSLNNTDNEELIYYNNLIYQKPDKLFQINNLNDGNIIAEKVVKNNNEIIMYGTENGNTIWTFLQNIDTSNYNYIKVTVTIDQFINTDTEKQPAIRLFTYCAKNGASSRTYAVRWSKTEASEVEYIIDLQYLSVYEDYNISTLQLSLSTIYLCEVHITKIDVEYISNESSEDIFTGTLENTLSTLNSKIQSMQSTIDTINQSKYILGSLGDKYVQQINSNTMQQVIIPVIPRKALFIGNSLIYGFASYGMAASEPNKCYYELCKSYIQSLNQSAVVNKLYGSPWEHCETSAEHDEFLNNTLLPMLSDDLDLVSVQAVDNVNNDAKRALFPTDSIKYLQFIRKHAPNARVIWVAGWYNHNYVKYVIDACNKTGCEFIDIREYFKSGITTNKLGGVYLYNTDGSTRTLNITVNSYNNDATNNKIDFNITVDSNTIDVEGFPYQSINIDGNNLSIVTSYNYITNAGVASHPNDEGMRLIANKILYGLGISDNEETYDSNFNIN